MPQVQVQEIDVQVELLNGWEQGQTFTRQQLINRARKIDPSVNAYKMSQYIRWMKHHQNIVEIEPDVYGFVDAVDRRSTVNNSEAKPRNGHNHSTRVEIKLNPAPTPQHERIVQSNPDGERRELSSFFKKSDGHAVRIIRDEILLEDIAQLTIVFGSGAQFNYALTSDKLRMDNSGGIPEWSPNQATNYDVIQLIAVGLDGRITEVPIRRDRPLTIDSE
jgi:hypothetical protein